MAIIVRHLETGARFVLLGAGYGAARSERPSVFFGHWVPHGEEGHHPMVCLCTEAGKIGFARAEAVEVESIDGLPVGQAFEAAPGGDG